MKIILNDYDKKFLIDNDFSIDYEKDYTDDEYLEVLDDLYFQEISNVDLDEYKANRFADIADIVFKLGEMDEDKIN